ncbi:MAG: pyridoxal-phosphate dependent enzyme, partial [Candidatus Cybelea sp.]
MPQLLATTCPHDGAPLLVRYGGVKMSRATVRARAWTMWRYREMLPIANDEEPISLGEGATPLLALTALAADSGDGALYLKDEGQNPTGSFKARGMSVAVTVAKRVGAA